MSDLNFLPSKPKDTTDLSFLPSRAKGILDFLPKKPIEMKMVTALPREFHPEGDGYDYEVARNEGLLPDEKGHWPSRSPRTGMILKGAGHPTFAETIESENDLGYEVYKGEDGRYYSKQSKEALEEKYRGDIERHPYLQAFLNAFYQGKLVGKEGVSISTLIDEYFDKNKDEAVAIEQYRMSGIPLSPSDIYFSGERPELMKKRDDPKRTMAEFAGHVAFDIPFLVAAQQLNPLKGAEILSNMGKLGKTVLTEAGFGATFGALRGENPLTEAAIFVGFGLTARGLGKIAKEVTPIFNKAKTVKEAHDEILNVLPKTERQKYIDWWESPDVQRKIQSIENRVDKEYGLRKSAEGAKKLKEDLAREEKLTPVIEKAKERGQKIREAHLEAKERRSLDAKEIGAKTEKPSAEIGVKGRTEEQIRIRDDAQSGVEAQKEVIKIPEFTTKSSTGDALEFAKKIKGNQEVIDAIYNKRQEIRSEIYALKGTEEAYGKSKVAQLYREVWEDATGKSIVEPTLKELSGTEYVKGIAQAIKKDITDVSAGITPQFYKNLEAYLKANKLKLSPEEREKIIRLASELAKSKIPMSEEKRLAKLEELIRSDIKVPQSKTAITGIQDALPEVSVQVSRPAPNSVKIFLKHYFKSGGNKPDVLEREITKAKGRIKVHALEIGNIEKELEQAIKKSKIKELKTAGGMEKLNQYLKGEIDKTGIPPDVVKSLDKMRLEIDKLSWELTNSGLVGDELGMVIEENMGRYVTRTYRKFIENNYKPNDDVYNKAIQMYTKLMPEEMVSELPGLNYVGRRVKLANSGYDNIQRIASADPQSLVRAINSPKFTKEMAEKAIAEAQKLLPDLSNRITGRVEFLLSKDIDKESFGRMFTIGRVNLSSLKQRKEINEVIRDLYGEVKDPFVNFHVSATKISSMLENRKMLDNLKVYNTGLKNGDPQKFFYDKPYDRFSVKISSEGNKALEPIAGLHTTPEIHKEITQMYGNENFNKLINIYSTLNSLAKYSKTVTSPITISRNYTGNTGFAMANGHYHLEYMPKSIKMVIDGGKGESSDLYKQALSLGVIKDNVYSGELKAALRDMGLRSESGGFVTAEGL